MTKILKKLFSKKNKKAEFSGFFRDASMDEKKTLLEKVVREANQDQRDLVEKYDKIYSKSRNY
ncbi:MAG: hypothetical protein Q8Q89_03280 [bacterium]|nr:hypothetical protein [bacterium]